MVGSSRCVGLVLGENGASCQPTAAAAAYTSYFLLGSGRRTPPFLWVQVLKPELAFFFKLLYGVTITLLARLAGLLGLASICDFGDDKY